MENLDPLTAVSPLDGRYATQTAGLRAYFSEFALIRYRIKVEVEYFIALCQLPLPQLSGFDTALFPKLREIHSGFGLAEAAKVKAFEKTTNHDVKAVEYFIKEAFQAMGLSAYQEFVHFGLTSQDINNTAVPLMIKDAQQVELLPLLAEVQAVLKNMAVKWEAIPMLAFTHGQPASPTRMGKEMAVFAYRLKKQAKSLEALPFPAKFGGATGNFNAHAVAYPDTDWPAFADSFVNTVLGLERNLVTTQIDNYDGLAAIFDNYSRICAILIDFARDIWQYVSMGYFKQRVNKNEVGSSAMPHKVNPIDFENAEGNLGLAQALFGHLSTKLPVSRLQRDLTDSTVLRNVGVPFGHLAISLKSLLKGLGKLELNNAALEADLERNWAVVAEAIQTVLRREGYPQPYEALKELTRSGNPVSQRAIATFIDGLDIDVDVKSEIKKISPFNYTGFGFGEALD